MIKKSLLLLTLILVFTSINAQNHQLPLKSNKEVDPIKFVAKNAKSFQLKISFDKLNWKTNKVKTGDSFTEIWFDKSNTVGEVGTPQLPAYKKLVLLPYGATATARVKNYTQSEYTFKEIGLVNPIMPVQPSMRKDEDSTNVPFQFKKEAYLKQAYIQNSIVTLEVLGNMRAFTIARITVTPVDYNPAKGNLKVFNDLDIEISVSSSTKSDLDLSSISSPYFDFLTKSMLNATETINDQHPDLTKYPVKMLIISNRMFESSLAPFVQWKTQKGIKVTTAYTDIIGTTPALIKTYIQQQYNAATPEDPAPTFLVFVGDVQQVPSSQTGTQSGKQTDLYYASTDGDIFPEMYYGRLSATTAQELDNIINKIIYYEKYQFANPEYLNRVTLIAGEDSDWNTRVAQPTLKYGTANYFNSSKGFSTVNEYGVTSDPNNPAAQSSYTGCYNSDKISVGFINYTAHCNETSWAGPSLSISSVNAFTNQYNYPVAVANCCLSGDFGTSVCIGEAWIRAQNKGAVTYIGSSPNSYWLEDMYWSVGAYPMVGNNNGYVPTFAETTTGAYDAPFVSNYRTTGAMVFAGNLAVTEVELKDYSRQINATYYWEAYNILGDPSLMPYFTTAESNEVNHESTIPVGVTSIKIGALKDSYVSITKNSEIIGTAYFNESQEIDIPIQNENEPSSLVITVTRPQTIPYIDTIEMVVVSGPYISLNSTTVNDSEANNNGKIDFGETVKMNLVIKNVGNSASSNTRILLTNHTGKATLTSSDSVFIGNIPSGTDNNPITLNNAFTFDISSNVADKTTEKFILTFKSDQGTWTSSLNLTINAPKISTEELKIDDSILGDNNGLPNAGESFHGIIPVKNSGNSAVNDLQIMVSVPDSLADFVVLNYEFIGNIPVNAGETYNHKFRINLNPSISRTLKVPVILTITSATNNTLNQEVTSYFTVEANNLIKMKDQTVSTCLAFFTDSGGETAGYSSNESATTTIKSAYEYAKLKVSFSQFALETNYDFLYVYDGESIGAKQVTGSPFHGATIPADILSSGNSLTFRFVSDESNNQSGWKANVSCIIPSQIPLCVSNPSPANSATNVIPNTLSWTGSNDAQFYDVYLGYSSESLSFLGRTNKPSIDINIERGKTYYWRVIPGNYLGICDNTCETWNFQTSTTIGEIRMSNNIVTVDSTWFYDSGGSSNNYYDSENYTLTFVPKIVGTKVKVSFEQFDVETYTNCGYDNLKLFDGPSINSTLIGKYCGTTLPATYSSTSDKGELTFQFYSDVNTSKLGWKAKITTEPSSTFYTLTVLVKNNGAPISNATVRLNGHTKITDSSGELTFSIPSGIFNYTVSATGYTSVSDTGTNNGSNQSITVDLNQQYNSTITILDKTTGLPIHGAKVTINDNYFFSNPSGVVSINSSIGNNNITIEATEYATLNSAINVSSNGENFEFKLDTEKYNVTLRVTDINGSLLSSALIQVNSISLTTDNSGLATVMLPYGIHKVKVSRELFLTSEQWVNITNDGQVNIYLDFLASGVSEVSYSVFSKGPLDTIPLQNASILIYIGTDVYSQLTTSELGQSKISLPAGSYKYSINKEGYESLAIKNFNVDNNKIEFKDTLTLLTYNITFDVKYNGSAVVGANVNLSGYSTRVTDNQGIVIIENIGYAKGLSYDVQKDGFEVYRGTLDVSSNATNYVNLIPTDIEETTKEKLNIYPNPVTDILFIESEHTIQTIQIISVTGMVIIEKQVMGSEISTIPVSNLTKGTYIARFVFTNGKIVHTKLIKI